MQTTLLSSKGQVIIPKPLRDAHRWHTGTRLEVLETADGILLKPLQATAEVELMAGLAAIRKRIAYNGPALSIEDMNAAIVKAAAGSEAARPRKLGKAI